MNRIIVETISLFMSSTMVVCGFKLMTLFQTEPKLLFLFSGLFLMMHGLYYPTTFLFDKVNDWNVKRLSHKQKSTQEVQNE